MSRITHHTSHIANCMWNCKFYQIFRIIVVVHLGKSFKLNLNRFMKHFFIKIIVLTKQMRRLNPKLVKLNILWGKKISSKKLSSLLKNPKLWIPLRVFLEEIHKFWGIIILFFIFYIFFITSERIKTRHNDSHNFKMRIKRIFRNSQKLILNKFNGPHGPHGYYKRLGLV